jgi:hypothetical protein
MENLGKERNIEGRGGKERRMKEKRSTKKSIKMRKEIAEEKEIVRIQRGRTRSCSRKRWRGRMNIWGKTKNR